MRTSFSLQVSSGERCFEAGVYFTGQLSAYDEDEEHGGEEMQEENKIGDLALRLFVLKNLEAMRNSDMRFYFHDKPDGQLLFSAANYHDDDSGSVIFDVTNSGLLENEALQNLQRIIVVNWVEVKETYRGKEIGLKMLREVQTLFSGDLILMDPTPPPFRQHVVRVARTGNGITDDMDEEEFAAAAKAAREKICNYWAKCGFMKLLIMPTDFIFYHDKLAEPEKSAKDEG